MNVLHPIARPGSANLTAMIGAHDGTGPLAPALVARSRPDLAYGELDAFLRETAAADVGPACGAAEELGLRCIDVPIDPDVPFPRN
jgi:hypothetical protein